MDLNGNMKGARPAHGSAVHAPDRATDAWRTCRADAIGAAGLRRMKAGIAATAPSGDARWRRAAAGDVSAAIGIALDMVRWSGGGARLDAAMTALAVCALEGSAAACLVMAHVIRRLPRAGPAEARLATGWLTRAFEGIPRATGHDRSE